MQMQMAMVLETVSLWACSVSGGAVLTRGL